ncbi:unnamed protein product [Sphenostylis stenocarpa]|uniref:60S ribosomal protein L6 n=1 Tax=Sphenostylis stenocarpa TaxID=92480 RepID=A0AA86VY58_9FABA|nr:unnamed protein product [Sphenostylis stenocarpa]
MIVGLYCRVYFDIAFCLAHVCHLGPFKINGVPLRRVNQSYVIATSTKVDVFTVNMDKFDDKYFPKESQKKKKKGEGESFIETEKKAKKEDQKNVDSALIKTIESIPDLNAYLGASKIDSTLYK